MIIKNYSNKTNLILLSIIIFISINIISNFEFLNIINILYQPSGLKGGIKVAIYLFSYIWPTIKKSNCHNICSSIQFLQQPVSLKREDSCTKCKKPLRTRKKNISPRKNDLRFKKENLERRTLWFRIISLSSPLSYSNRKWERRRILIKLRKNWPRLER